MTGPLVVEADNEDAEGANLEGAGYLSSWADLDEAVAERNPDAGEILFAAAAAGLDTLDVAMDPLGALTAAGLGWLVEHVWFLHEPLDALAGDPTQITAQAQTWHNAATEMRRVAAEYRSGAEGLTGWEGTAGAAYRDVARGYTARLDSGAAAADRLAELVLTSGVAVATVRALIRDVIADFVARVIVWAVGAAVAAWVSAGGSLLALAAQVTAAAAHLASDMATRIARLLDDLAAAGDDVTAVAESLRGLATGLRRLPFHGAGDVRGVVAATAEAGKQHAEARRAQQGWAR